MIPHGIERGRFATPRFFWSNQVFVYSQTVIIDESITFDFALLLRTRQLIVDRKFAPKIEVSLTFKFTLLA